MLNTVSSLDELDVMKKCLSSAQPTLLALRNNIHKKPLKKISSNISPKNKKIIHHRLYQIYQNTLSAVQFVEIRDNIDKSIRLPSCSHSAFSVSRHLCIVVPRLFYFYASKRNEFKFKSFQTLTNYGCSNPTCGSFYDFNERKKVTEDRQVVGNSIVLNVCTFHRPKLNVLAVEESMFITQCIEMQTRIIQTSLTFAAHQTQVIE
ncbi:hypothetical protein AGLY_016384 [Aphis glycines]|uniref:Uncharacterized protein n=1 Tax=Aphis glycines TaxID=307491 RepID=A0A6G0SZY7_APHGL|nr:hypothetical protein AGLY_016384 [Aphis glycines]